jgi:branched-chain amino acid transport system ATP-binding protein
MHEALVIEKLSAGYGGSTVLHDVGLKLLPGKICCILGRNGVGKTTLIQSLAGHLPIRSGRIVLGNSEISRLPAYKRARAGMALAPQGRRLFSTLTVREHLQIAENLLSKGSSCWNFDRILEVFPRLRERLDSFGQTLSGGEQSMLSIGRLLVANPQVGLLDEPSEGLSPILVQQVAEVLRIVRDEGGALLLVEQNFRLAMQVADEVHLMNKGRIVFSGTPAELLADVATRQQYLGG